MSAPLLEPSPGFPSLLQDFFCKRLLNQRNVTARTVACYRDAFRLLLSYTEVSVRWSAPPVRCRRGRLWLDGRRTSGDAQTHIS